MTEPLAMSVPTPDSHMAGVAPILLAIQDVPPERRMDAVATALAAWVKIDYGTGTKIGEGIGW